MGDLVQDDEQQRFRDCLIKMVAATDVTTHIPFMKKFNELHMKMNSLQLQVKATLDRHKKKSISMGSRLGYQKVAESKQF